MAQEKKVELLCHNSNTYRQLQVEVGSFKGSCFVAMSWSDNHFVAEVERWWSLKSIVGELANFSKPSNFSGELKKKSNVKKMYRIFAISKKINKKQQNINISILLNQQCEIFCISFKWFVLKIWIEFILDKINANNSKINIVIKS